MWNAAYAKQGCNDDCKLTVGELLLAVVVAEARLVILALITITR
jgi:hypothetical protein